MLHWIASRINEWIMIEIFGVVRPDDEAKRGYYIVKWVSKPCIVQKNIIVKEDE